MREIVQAFEAQDVEVIWRGPQPGTAEQLTAEYLAELVDELPRMRPADAVIDFDQLRADYQAALDAQAAAAAVEAEDDAASETIRQDNRLRTLLTASPAQIETWIDNNVTNLAEAKEALAILALGLSMLARKTLHD
jgi:hypothetical protein